MVKALVKTLSIGPNFKPMFLVSTKTFRSANQEQRKNNTTQSRRDLSEEEIDIGKMAEKKDNVPPDYDVNAKWDACLDLTFRRFVYSSLGGAFAGLLFFRSPVTRWASIAFGAGLGIGSAYTDCSRAFDSPSSSSPNLAAATPKITETSVSQAMDE